MSVSNNTTVTITESSSTLILPQISHKVRFWYFLCFDVLSVSCAILTLYFLVTDRVLRRALNNHVYIVLLSIVIVYEVVDIPFFLRNTFYETPWQASNDFYLFWAFSDYLLFVLQIELFAWSTVERHILVFHESWVGTSKKRFFFHYFPIIVIIIYNIVFYIIVYYGVSCDNSFDDFLHGSIYVPCTFDQTILGSLDLFLQQVIPMLTIIVASFGLLGRIAIQKARVRQAFQWRKYRKLTIQSVSISAICILFNSPWVFTALAFQCGAPIEVVLPILTYSNFVYYNIPFCFPFVCCLTLAELRKKFKHLIFCNRYQRIDISAMTNTGTNKTR